MTFSSLPDAERASICERIHASLSRGGPMSSTALFMVMTRVGIRRTESNNREPKTLACALDALREMESRGAVRANGSNPELWSVPRR